MEASLTAPNGHTWSQPRGLFINNEFVASSNGQTLSSINPATETEICSVYAATAEDVDRAVAAARAALAGWKQTPGTERGRLLYRLAELVDESANRATLAVVEAVDSGKPLAVTQGYDAPELAATLRYYAGFADKSGGQTIDVDPAKKLAYTRREPVGVCAQIIPWNFPLVMAAWKLGPALCCGNTVVLKPAEQTPLSALVLATLVKKAGFPPGVVNVVNGHGRETGAALAAHPDVDKVAFTGSTATGAAIMRSAAGTLKNITLETGGKSPLLVFADADLDRAADWAHRGIMFNSGQICTGTSRLLVHASVADAFVQKFAAQTARVSVVGDPFDPATYQGPQVSQQQHDRILALVQSGRDQGAAVAFGGQPVAASTKPGGKGYYIQPTLFTGVRSDMRIYREEIFGPVAVLATFETDEQAVRMANDSPYGLGAALFTQNVGRAHRIAAALDAGMVWINSSNDVDRRVPFGGVKQSGIGRELGEAGLSSYYVIKAVHVNLDS